MSKKGCKRGPYGLGHKSNNKQDKSEDKVCDDYSHQQIVKRLKNQLMKRAEESNELQVILLHVNKFEWNKVE